MTDTNESVQNLSDIASLLHADDSEMVLLVDPDQEGLVLVVVDATPGWPVAARIRLFQEPEARNIRPSNIYSITIYFTASASQYFILPV